MAEPCPPRGVCVAGEQESPSVASGQSGGAAVWIGALNVPRARTPVTHVDPCVTVHAAPCGGSAQPWKQRVSFGWRPAAVRIWGPGRFWGAKGPRGLGGPLPGRGPETQGFPAGPFLFLLLRSAASPLGRRVVGPPGTCGHLCVGEGSFLECGGWAPLWRALFSRKLHRPTPGGACGPWDPRGPCCLGLRTLGRDRAGPPC